MDAFTNASGQFQHAKNLRANPLPLAAGEVAEFRKERPGVASSLLGLVFFLAIALTAVAILGGGNG